MSGTTEQQQEKKPLTKEEKELIEKESASARIAYVAIVGALRELKNSYMHTAVFQDKYIINQVDKSLNRMFSHFDKQGLMNHPIYDALVEGIVEYVDANKQQLFKMMTDGDDVKVS